MREHGEFTDREKLLLWLNYGTEHDTRRFAATCARFSALEEAYMLFAGRRTALFDFLPARCIARLTEAAQDGFLDRFTAELAKKKIAVCFREDAEYPALLNQIHDAPNVLYCRGRLPAEPALSLAVIGTRAPSEYGKDVARLFAHSFAEAGALVVSGMASGIDTYAAKGALAGKAACPTVAVLGTGVDVIYPAENRNLYEEIIARGAVISEFLPGTGPQPYHFPVRNRIMSGMCHGVVVVEAGERSGTSITAGFALEEGREVFAVPGRIMDPKSLGPNRMIRDGEAKPVFSADDVLCEFPGFAAGVPGENADRQKLSDLPPMQQSIVKSLRGGELSIDELSEKLSLSMGELNSTLTELRFSGIIKQLLGRVYALDTMRCVIE